MNSARARRTLTDSSRAPAATSTPALKQAPARTLMPSAPPAIRLSSGAKASSVHAPQAGAPLPEQTQAALEQSFDVDLGAVRVHSDGKAAEAAGSLSARAFAYGNHIFLGAGERPSNLGLMAHEATHVVQQQGAPAVQLSSALGASDAFEREAQQAATAVQAGEPFSVRERTRPRVQRLGISDALNFFAERANLIPGFRMFTIILGINPINMSRVERSAANILRALVEFMPGGGLIVMALDNFGIFDRVGSWVEEQLRTLGLTANVIRQAVMDFVNSLGVTDLLSPGGVWERARRIFTDPIDRIVGLARRVVPEVIRFIKDAILRPLAQLAQGTRGYDLLKAVLGQDPITGEAVPRNAETLIGGFMKLIDQEEVWNNLKRANAVPRAWAWFQGALNGLMGYVRAIPSLFLSALQSLELADIILVPRAFARIARVFVGFVGDFLSWAGAQVMDLLQIIFDVVAPAVMPYIRRAGGALRTIIQNPIGFIGNLVRAGIQGLRQFASNFLSHLRASLIGWLTGTLSGVNVYIPQAFTLIEIIKFVLSVLGLTWQNIRQKLVRAIGETAVRALEAGFDLVVTLLREGPAAAWQKIVEGITNLREMVMEQVMTFVRDRIVQAAITTLVTSLNPAGAFIQAVLAIYNTVMFFVERLRQIAQVVAAFIDSIAAIASGNISAAANRVEQTMAGLLTLVISFLARIARLGRVSDAVVNIVNRIRAPIDRALDRVAEWIRQRAQSFMQRVAGGTPEQRLEQALTAAQGVLNRFAGRRVGAVVIRPLLAAIRIRYQLQSLEPVEDNGYWAAEGVVNPRRKGPRSQAQAEGQAGQAPAAPLDPSTLAAEQPIELRRSRGVADTRTRDPYIWFVAVITEVNLQSRFIRWRSANLSAQRTGTANFTDFGTLWVRGHSSQVRFSEERMAQENQKERWGDMETARRVLNYRHHGAETNIAGYQWEHIIEQNPGAGGEHSSSNLALTSSTINNRLGVLFGQSYSSAEAPPGLEGTGGRPLRQHLAGKPQSVQRIWKFFFYNRLNVELVSNGSERGRWMELVRR